MTFAEAELSDVRRLHCTMTKLPGFPGTEPQPHTPRFDFVPGDDFGLYLVTSDPSAHAWKVLVQRPSVAPVQAEKMPTEYWLHPYRRLMPNEHCWDIGLSTLEPPGTTVIIQVPGSRKPLVVAHKGATAAT